MNKYIEYFKKLNKNAIINIVLVCGIVGYIAYAMDLKMPTMSETKEVEKLVPRVLEVKPKAKAECSPLAAKLILTDSMIAKSMNLLVVDLNSYETVETKEVTGYFTKEKLYGVNRSLVPKTKGSSQYYITIYEPLDKLNYNKKTYENLGSGFKKVAD